MEAGVPFALVSTAQLLAFAAAVGLGLSAFVRAPRTSRMAVPAGALLLVVAHVVTGASLGSASSSGLAVVRASGYLLIALGLLPEWSAGTAVVAPLGAAGGAVAYAVATAGIAALVALVRQRGRSRWALGGGLLLWAVAEGLAGSARTSATAAIVLLSARSAGSLLVLVHVGVVATRSILGKVVGAILAGTLVLALGVAGTVGSVLTSSLARDLSKQLTLSGAGQVDSLSDEVLARLRLAKVVTSCPANLVSACVAATIRAESENETFSAFLKPDGRGGASVVSSVPKLDAVALASLAQSGAVRDVVSRRGNDNDVATLFVLYKRDGAVVSAIGVSGASANAQTTPSLVVVDGVVLGRARMAAVKRATTFDATLLVGDRVTATTLPTVGPGTSGLDQIRAQFTRRGLVSRFAEDPTLTGVTVTAEGSRPAMRFVPLQGGADQGTVATLVLTSPSTVILRTQRGLLRTLFTAIAAIALLVGIVAIAVARRLVQPVRRLTEAAARVRRGDLTATAGVRSTDEVGVLAQQFDAMTLSLSAMTTDLRDAAEQESALRARLETVVDSIGDGLLTTDAHGAVSAVNPAAVALLGADATAVVGRPVADVLAGLELRGAEPHAGLLHRSDGRVVPVVSVVAPLRSGDGVVIVLRDTTREREIERMKTEFLSNVSHELRTPLTPIRGYAELLRRRPDVGVVKTQEYASSILESSQRMARVVDLLVDVAALEAGRVEPQPVTTDIASFLDARLAVWRRREPGREFRRRIAAGLPPVSLDPVWTAKAYDELVDNAVKYSDKPVVLGASRTDDGLVRLSVRDAGPGIPADARGALFTAFEQVDGSATREVGGLGLGLSFVQRVAGDFGMRLEVESSPGRGSTFSLDVPVVGRVPRPRKPAAARRSRARR